jgi:isocitrate lyase
MDSEKAGVFHHLLLPTYHTTALHMNDLTQGYFGRRNVSLCKGVQRQEIRKGVACVKHQRMGIESW